MLHRRTVAAGAGIAALAAAGLVAASGSTSSAGTPKALPHRSAITASPIKHLVVIFDENVSYDHYFGTYPHARNTDGTPFYAVTSPPERHLVTSHRLTDNPNLYEPSRLSPDQALTCDQNHGYGAEQQATNNGVMDEFLSAPGARRGACRIWRPNRDAFYDRKVYQSTAEGLGITAVRRARPGSAR